MTVEWYFEKLFEWTGLPESYRKLIRALFDTVYILGHPFDENRVEDAQEFRRDAIGVLPWLSDEPTYLQENTTLLEVMIALCERLVWQTDEEVMPNEIFQVMIDNADLNYLANSDLEELEQELHAIMTNDFPEDGMGSFFPIGHRHISKSTFHPVNELDLFRQGSQYLYLEGF